MSRPFSVFEYQSSTQIYVWQNPARGGASGHRVGSPPFTGLVRSADPNLPPKVRGGKPVLNAIHRREVRLLAVLVLRSTGNWKPCLPLPTTITKAASRFPPIPLPLHSSSRLRVPVVEVRQRLFSPSRGANQKCFEPLGRGGKPSNVPCPHKLQSVHSSSVLIISATDLVKGFKPLSCRALPRLPTVWNIASKTTNCLKHCPQDFQQFETLPPTRQQFEKFITSLTITTRRLESAKTNSSTVWIICQESY